MKDHLGTPRVVIDQNGDIISAEDLDMWGYRMSDRSFQSDTTFYKYTGKERDVSTGFDYFGARYYDSRLGRWGQVEPLLENFFDESPYNYSLNNPLRLVDDDGRSPRASAAHQMIHQRPIEQGGGGGASISVPFVSVQFVTVTSSIWRTVVAPIIGYIRLHEFLVEGLTIYDDKIDVQNIERSKEEGLESQFTKNIEGHLKKLSEMSPENPDPTNLRDKWKRDIRIAIREAHKDFQSMYRKVKNKDFVDYLKNKFVKERVERVFDELKNHGIDFQELIK